MTGPCQNKSAVCVEARVFSVKRSLTPLHPVETFSCNSVSGPGLCSSLPAKTTVSLAFEVSTYSHSEVAPRNRYNGTLREDPTICFRCLKLSAV